MQLPENGIDLIYVDESVKHPFFAVSSVRVPFLRPTDGRFEFVWEQYRASAEQWRRDISKTHNVKFRMELHSNEILQQKGCYRKNNTNLYPDESVALVEDALSRLGFLPDGSIFCAVSDINSSLNGAAAIEACMIALFQRLRMQCLANKVAGMVFFDEGHDEYVSYYRRAQKYLPTGSMMDGWQTASGNKFTKNMPLDMFPKDANFKKSKLSLFLQIADLVVYTARLKIENEKSLLAAKRVKRNHHTLYDKINNSTLNLRATYKRQDAIILL